MLLTHHQPFGAYDDTVGQSMTDKVKAVVAESRPLDVWIWGHEHRCTIYGDNPKRYLKIGFCSGNGGVPQLLPDPPRPGTPAADDPQHAALTWAYQGAEQADGNDWLRFGFAVLDFDGPSMNLRYFDERPNEATNVTMD